MQIWAFANQMNNAPICVMGDGWIQRNVPGTGVFPALCVGKPPTHGLWNEAGVTFALP